MIPMDKSPLPPTHSLRSLRLEAVLGALRASGAQTVIDLGCGEGRLLELLLKDGNFSHLTGFDLSESALKEAAQRVSAVDAHLDPARFCLERGSLLTFDDRIRGFDAATLVEVIEHFDLRELVLVERVIFEFARPTTLIITTPNCEYNVNYKDVYPSGVRHLDHRFEWTRTQFREWATNTGHAFSYLVNFLSVGPDDPLVGAPTQMAVFSRQNV